MSEREEILEALMWAWTNATGRLPDHNTMSEPEIAQYWSDYRDVLKRAIVRLTKLQPDEYLRGEAHRAVNAQIERR